MKTFKLFWSPEGKHIDTVQAETLQLAKRKAPQPYRQYLGEVYAVEVSESLPESQTFLRASSETWAKHCANFRCYGSEPSADIMVHKIIAGYDKDGNIIPGAIVGKVDYSTNPPTYFISYP